MNIKNQDRVPVENCRPHIVALTLVADYETASYPRKYKDRTASGIIIAIDEDWFWVTAGHFFAEMLKKEFDEGWRFNHWQFLFRDGENALLKYFSPFGLEDENGQFSLEQENFRCVFDEDSGEDSAFIRLTDDYKNFLEAHNVQPLREEHWGYEIALEEERYVQYVLMGYPTELAFPTNRDEQQERKITLELVFIRVDRTDRKAETGEEIQKSNLFEGLHHNYREDTDDFKDLNGMSGGPIFRIWVDDKGQDHHHIVAILLKAGDFSQKVEGYKIVNLIPKLKDFLRSDEISTRDGRATHGGNNQAS